MNVTLENILSLDWSEDYDLRERIKRGDDASEADRYNLEQICHALADYTNNDKSLTQQRRKAKALLQSLTRTAANLSALIGETESNKYAWGAILGTFDNDTADKQIGKFNHQTELLKELGQTFAKAYQNLTYPDSLPPPARGNQSNPALDELIARLHYPLQEIIRRSPGSVVQHTEEANIILEILQSTGISDTRGAKTIQNRLSALPRTRQDWLIAKSESLT